MRTICVYIGTKGDEIAVEFFYSEIHKRLPGTEGSEEVPEIPWNGWDWYAFDITGVHRERNIRRLHDCLDRLK